MPEMERGQRGSRRAVRSMILAGFRPRRGRQGPRPLTRRLVLLQAIVLLGLGTSSLSAQVVSRKTRTTAPPPSAAADPFRLEASPKEQDATAVDRSVRPAATNQANQGSAAGGARQATRPAAAPRASRAREAAPPSQAAKEAVKEAGPKVEASDEKKKADNVELTPKPKTEIKAEAEVKAGAEEDEASPDLSFDLEALRAETTEDLKKLEEAEKASRADDPEVEEKGEAAKEEKKKEDPAKAEDPEKKAESQEKTTVDQARRDRSAIREVLLQRVQTFERHDRLVKLLDEMLHPKVTPEQQVITHRSRLDQLNADLAKPAQELLPPTFGEAAAGAINDAARAEMNKAIEAAKAELNDCQTQYDSGRIDPAKLEKAKATLKVERDQTFQQVSKINVRAQELENEIGAATPGIGKRIAYGRLKSFKLEARVDTLRLKVIETKIRREEKMAEVNRLGERVLEASVQRAKKILDQMQLHYRSLAETQQRVLERAAATQETKARESDDPLERYKAVRWAELLELEARVIKHEQTLASDTSPSLEEQRDLADKAEAGYAEVRELVKDGSVSRLDALRLNNDFRRIGPERDRLVRNELATIETHLQFYENALTTAEFELLEDSMVDQIEHEAVLERLAPARHAEAKREFVEMEKKHLDLLQRRREVLSKLAVRAAQTLQQVTRRQGILEDEYGFIRTHIFWVRDQEPLWRTTFRQAGGELRRLGKGLFKLADDASDSKQWRTPPSEFMAVAFAAVVLPLGLFRLRSILRKRMTALQIDASAPAAPAPAAPAPAADQTHPLGS